MKTHTVHSELVYRLAASNNISASLKKFGIDKTSTSLILAIFDASSEEIESSKKRVIGDEVQNFDPHSTAKIEDIKKVRIILGALLTQFSTIKSPKKNLI
eukprot:TRINITY_DN6637_c0_g1_i1.p1 TRINITY_DN6637_c0_g1~~TRINITY_DN6637_c0_g1_i1.p1  ORF type:complete len:100 (+),score=14.22 TRINITY_DN6637_c0_g1_i1:245-544(+)